MQLQENLRNEALINKISRMESSRIYNDKMGKRFAKTLEIEI